MTIIDTTDSDFRPPWPISHMPFIERAGDSAGVESGQLNLGAFLTLRLVDQFASGNTQSRGTLYQIEATRDYLTDLPQGTEEVELLLGIVEACGECACAEHLRPLWQPLVSYADWLEQDRPVAEILDVLRTALRVTNVDDVEEAIQTHLRCGAVLLSCLETDEADDAFKAAGKLASGLSNEHWGLISRTGRARVLIACGNFEQSERALEKLRKDAQKGGDRKAEALVCQQLAEVCRFTNRVDDAVAMAFEAVACSHTSLDRQQSVEILGYTLSEAGHYQPAEDAFNFVLQGEPPPRLRVRALTQLLQLAGLRGNRVGFERLRLRIPASEEDLTETERRDLEVTLGMAFARFRKTRQAVHHLENAMRLTEEAGLYDYAGPDRALLEGLSVTDPVLDYDKLFLTLSRDVPPVPAVAEKLRALLSAG